MSPLDGPNVHGALLIHESLTPTPGSRESKHYDPSLEATFFKTQADAAFALQSGLGKKAEGEGSSRLRVVFGPDLAAVALDNAACDALHLSLTFGCLYGLPPL